MPLHLETPWDSSWANSIDFYPGTSFTYLVPMAAHTSLSLYSNMLGFVTMQKTEQQILSSGLQDMQALPLNRLFASHACLPSNESSLECQLDSHVEKLDNMYVDSMSAWTEQTPIAEYVYPNDDYATTVSTNYCCEVALSVCLCFWRVSYLPPFYKNSLSLTGVISGISRWGNTRIFFIHRWRIWISRALWPCNQKTATRTMFLCRMPARWKFPVHTMSTCGSVSQYLRVVMRSRQQSIARRSTAGSATCLWPSSSPLRICHRMTRTAKRVYMPK